jgi:hypothetical protein
MALWLAVIPVAGSILIGALALSWRLGRMDGSIKDLGRRVDRLSDRVDDK